MYPLIHIAGKEIPTYALMALIGALVAGMFAEHQAVKRGVHPFYVIEVMLYSVIGVVIGGHLLYGLVNLRHLDQGLAYVWGGQVFYGGLFGGLLTGALVIKKKKYPRYPYYDIAACAIPLFHSIARIGCFLTGCCYGIPSAVGFVYTESAVPYANGVVRFPVQLLESALNLALFGVLYGLLHRGKGKDHLLSLYLGCYALLRFGLEFLRGDDVLRGIWWGLSTSQWISISVALALLVYFVVWRERAQSGKS